MLGYLRADDPGRLQPPDNGWHDTGDIVTLDRDGFVTIKGRAKRFAKIGGEMVSLAAIETLVNELWPDHPSAAATVPDARKGERIILLTEQPEATRTALLAFAREGGASELMVPADVIVVPKLPLLGSGKVDHPAVGRMLEELIAKPVAAG
jgi:acyl-[acyl-carrier-protein]-phospholipid O-acyltransferase/long-chain-fatty-acid--[acyl-carrier-protein] ligase